MRAVLIILALSATAAFADPKPGDQGTPEFEKAAALIQQLGHPRFADREAAAKSLVEMGGLAVPALVAGTKASDEEIRSRSAALLPQAKAAEWKRRADVFLAKPGEKNDLPLLADWDKLVGKPDAASRKLFAEILRTNGSFLEEVASNREKAAGICASRSEAILDKVRSPKGQLKAEQGDLAAVLFVDSLAPGPLSLSETVPAYLLRNPGLAESMDRAETGPVVRRLLVRWVEAQPAYSPMAKIQFAELARKKPFPEAVAVLSKLSTDKTNRVLILRLLAVEALGAAGAKDAAAALAELVPDDSRMFEGRRTDEQRFGDQALAASLILHGKKIADYGLTVSEQLFFPPSGKHNIPMAVYGFPSADARAKATRRWADEVAAKRDGKK